GGWSTVSRHSRTGPWLPLLGVQRAPSFTAWSSVPARSARHRNRAGRLHLSPNPPTNLVGFGDDAVLVHREDLAVAHDELAVDHDRLDVGRLTVVDPRRDDAARRYEVGPLGVQDNEVGLPPDVERAEKRSLPHRSRTALRG